MFLLQIRQTIPLENLRKEERVCSGSSGRRRVQEKKEWKREREQWKQEKREQEREQETLRRLKFLEFHFNEQYRQRNFFFESMSRHRQPVMSSTTGACGRLLRDLLSHTEQCDFNTLTTWMKDPITQETARRAFDIISSDTIRINTRVGLALCMMAMDPTTTFEEGRQEDDIMSRESQRFHKTILKCLRQHEEGNGTFKIDDSWKRASRFYMAWMRQDKTHTLEQLMASVVARRVRDSSESTTSQASTSSESSSTSPPEETFAQIRLLGGDVAEQEARRMYNGAWRAVAAPDLAGNVAEIAQRAFWDAIAQHTADGNYESLFSVLGEIEESMRVMISYSPARQDELKDVFDPAFLKQQVEHGVLEKEDVVKMIRFLCKTIADWHASVDAEDASDWVVSVERILVDAPSDLGAFLISVLIPFLRDVVTRLQVLYGRVLQAAEELNKATSKE